MALEERVSRCLCRPQRCLEERQCIRPKILQTGSVLGQKSVALPVGTPICPYGIAYGRVMDE